MRRGSFVEENTDEEQKDKGAVRESTEPKNTTTFRKKQTEKRGNKNELKRKTKEKKTRQAGKACNKHVMKRKWGCWRKAK